MDFFDNEHKPKVKIILMDENVFSTDWIGFVEEHISKRKIILFESRLYLKIGSSNVYRRETPYSVTRPNIK